MKVKFAYAFKFGCIVLMVMTFVGGMFLGRSSDTGTEIYGACLFFIAIGMFLILSSSILSSGTKAPANNDF